MQIVFALEVRVQTWLAAGGRVEVPRPSSRPACGEDKVNFDGTYPRHTRRGRVAIQRVLCTNDEGCGHRSHSLLPDVLVSRRVDLASVIGWALEATAAGWATGRSRNTWGCRPRRCAAASSRRGGRGGEVAGRLWAVAAAAAPAVRAPSAGGPVVVLVGSAGRAAAAWSSLSGEPVDRWRFAVRHAGGRLLG